MGNINQEQLKHNQSTLQIHCPPTNKSNLNWQVLQKTNFKQILKSKRTSLVIQRYFYQVQFYEGFEQENKIYQWRNNNPNHDLMINVLSVNKNQSSETNNCVYKRLCPSQQINMTVYVVTERVLKVGEINDLIHLQGEMENHQNSNNFSQATNRNGTKIQRKKQKLTPFLTIKINQVQAKRILKDWIRGIQLLCYKFGYFKIQPDMLSITTQKRGNVWINQNYALNYIDVKNKNHVTTAQQKFRYEKQAILKVTQIIERIFWFKRIVNSIKAKKIERFDDFFQVLDKSQSKKVSNNQKNKYSSTHKRVNTKDSHQSFVSSPHNNSNVLTAINTVKFQKPNFSMSENRINLESYSIVTQRAHMINSGSNQSLHYRILNELTIEKQLKRCKSGERQVKKVLPENKNDKYVTSNKFKNCCKQTAPTNNLINSSSVDNSIVNQPSNYKPSLFYKKNEIQDGRNLFRSQNTQHQSKFKKEQKKQIEKALQKSSSNNSNNLIFPQKNSSESYMFRSQSFNQSPRNHKFHIFSLDQTNMITGPYQTNRFYNNLQKQKIALVDSMVMVQEQNQDVQNDIQNMSGTCIIMEESVILRGENESKLSSPKNRSYY